MLVKYTQVKIELEIRDLFYITKHKNNLFSILIKDILLIKIIRSVTINKQIRLYISIIV